MKYAILKSRNYSSCGCTNFLYNNQAVSDFRKLRFFEHFPNEEQQKMADRLHPVISLCIYYGEDEWDGPLTLKEMLQIPEGYDPLVADYEMHLIEVKNSGTLKFHNEEVRMLFEICRMIYAKEMDKVNSVYENRIVDTEIFLAVGAITNSQRMINKALKAEKEGTQMTMCKALQEWEEQCTENGKAEGIIMAYLDMGISQNDIIEKVKKKLNLSEQEAIDYYNKFATA